MLKTTVKNCWKQFKQWFYARSGFPINIILIEGPLKTIRTMILWLISKLSVCDNPLYLCSSSGKAIGRQVPSLPTLLIILIYCQAFLYKICNWGPKNVRKAILWERKLLKICNWELGPVKHNQNLFLFVAASSEVTLHDVMIMWPTNQPFAFQWEVYIIYWSLICISMGGILYTDGQFAFQWGVYYIHQCIYSFCQRKSLRF